MSELIELRNVEHQNICRGNRGVKFMKIVYYTKIKIKNYLIVCLRNYVKKKSDTQIYVKRIIQNFYIFVK